MGCAWPPSRQYYLFSITVVRVYCCSQKCEKKKTENEQTRFFVKFLSLVAFRLRVPGPPGCRLGVSGAPWLLATPMILRQDRVLKFLYKKKHLKQNFFFFPKRGRLESSHLTVFKNLQKLHDIIMTWTRGRHYYYLLLKLQFLTRTTYYWLCSHYIYHW